MIRNFTKPLLVLILICLAHTSRAQQWDVPEDKAKAVSPFKFSKENQKKGEALFQQNCLSCHGTPGKNNFVNLTPSPGDPASEKFQKQTDGELFHKITAGRSPMPEFKNILTDEERWNLISYIRSFNTSYVQPEPAAEQTGVYSGVEVDMKIDFLSDQKKIKVTATGTKNGKPSPLEGIDINLYAKRYFGELRIDEPKSTNANGIALFAYTDSLNGDKDGNIALVAKISTEGLNGVKHETTLAIGRKNTAPSLIDTRAMWTVRAQAPIWLIAAYSLVVIGVWSFLIYIIFQIVKIRKHA